MRRSYVLAVVLAWGWTANATGQEVSISIDADRVVGKIDEKVYGHFLEHIFHSVNGGLWGEMIWDRSFEGGAVDSANWRIEADTLVQNGLDADVRLVFGDAGWKDYEFSLEARKTGGQEGFLVLFRVASNEHFYWANLGGWGNVRHALERGTQGQGRWGTVGRLTDGSIETGRWHRIKVRCEGAHVQVWLDGDRVIDFEDAAGGHMAGRVGVGTWSTKARFRNLKVMSLDGVTLFEGLPAVEKESAPPHGWEAYGQGQVYTTSEGALNCEVCRVIVCADGETGVGQSPVCLAAGERYYGSVWARGEGSGELSVRLTGGVRVLAEKVVGRPTGQWREYKFELSPVAKAEYGEIQVGARGRGRVWIDQVSLMSESARRVGGFRPDLLKAIADLKPPVIRWPGGSFSAFYRWKDGIGPQHKRVIYPRRMWGDLDTNCFGTDEFVRMCRAVGAEPLIVVNIGMHDAREKRDEYCREACEWVEYCNGPARSKWGGVRAANGHPEPYGVKYWEIDNEVWRLSPDDYSSVVRQFVPAMKKVDRSIIVAACGSGQLGHNWGAGDIKVVAECAELIDYLSVHHYESPSRFAEGPAAAERFFRERGELIDRSRNRKVKLYVSEWNAQSTDWRTGLYCGGILNVFERCSDIVGMAAPALFLRHSSAQSWDNAFVNFDHRTWFGAPNYVVMKLWREHYAPNRLEIIGDAGDLNMVATRSADGRHVYLKVVNPAAHPVQVRVDVTGNFNVSTAEMEGVAPGDLSARNTLYSPDSVEVGQGKVRGEGGTFFFALGRWSVAVVDLQK